MEFYSRKTLHTFMDVDRKKSSQSDQPTPPRLSFKSFEQISTEHHHNRHHDLNFSPSRSSTPSTSPGPAMYSIMPPPSPESPWTLSPHQTPSPSLLYHCIASLHRQEGIIYSIAVSRGTVYTGSESSRIHAWRQPECTERGYIKASCGEVRSILAYGNILFTSHKDCKVRMWNVTAVENFRAKKVATLPRRNPIFLFNKSSRNSHHQHRDFVSCMGYYHAEGLLYTGSWDNTVKAWRVSDGRCVDSFIAHDDNINAIVINQEDGCVFTCSSDGTVKIWRRVYGHGSHTLTITLKFQPSPINTLALSTSLTNSCILYSGSSDGFINFWEKEKNSSRFNHGGFLQGHRFAVLCLVAIENLIFSGSEDTTIRVWRREEGSYYHECLAVLDAHRGPVKCLAACLEIDKLMVMGFLVYSAGLDQTFKVWRVKVLPDENHVTMEGSNTDKSCDVKKIFGSEYEMSPVLSPSWVEKKRQGAHI
ncbi:OLC1v1029034C1 [Oldenlandia corymbosa var. corymbosa]|uniref:OLC1v1029034C1 n=1 Tax=Oldenlandia corymbosa var. corymbosa TaxID=529605 RepID=A0AAV1CFZ7_OLDCO|nr:OLC1v1029034C1 [Oldenlandia corymbosa var. corymbosa]